MASIIHPTRIAQIHASALRAMLVVTGGGTQAVADLLAVPGASRTVLEVVVPYSEAALAAFLGARPRQATSVETAAALARAAYKRAVALHAAEDPLLGVACTAALATDRLKKGAHRAHIGISTTAETRVYSYTLTKGARDRQGEERVVSDLLLTVLARACGLDATLGSLPLADERIEERSVALAGGAGASLLHERRATHTC